MIRRVYMAKKALSMKELTNHSIHITEDTIIVYPQFNAESSAGDCLDVCSKHNNKYCIYRGILAFVYDHELYVTSYTKGNFDCLRYHHLKPAKFWVPFSIGDYPKKEKSRWEKICKL